MRIESDDYYRIILSCEYNNAGAVFLEEMISDLSAKKRFSEVKNLQRYTASSYQQDTRCLIGFALAHDEYEFGIGGLSHVVGHEVIKPLRLLERLAGEIAHQAHAKIVKMVSVVESVSRKSP